MPDRPISFRGDMVRAVLEGKKSVTRRVVKSGRKRCPYEVGMTLWVKETWSPWADPETERAVGHGNPALYKADYVDTARPHRLGGLPKWKSPRFMPRWALRITLEVTEVRQERVQEITHEEAIAEGAELVPNTENLWHFPLDNQHRSCHAAIAFSWLWDEINAKRGYPWDSNPEVDVVRFERLSPA